MATEWWLWWLWWLWFGPECKCRISVDNASHNAPNYGGRVPVDTTPGPAPVCRALKTHPISPRTAPSGVKLPPSHDMATQAPALHIGVAESVQSADAEHVDTTAAVASMVLPASDCEGHRGRFHSWSRGHARPAELPTRDWNCQRHAHSMPRSKGRHNS